jgi:hypothetical protein
LTGVLESHIQEAGNAQARKGQCKATWQDKLTTQGKRDPKMTKWRVQILESGVGSAGFVEIPVTLWKEVPEEIR